MKETPNIFTILDRYIDDLFAPEDEMLAAALNEARKAGLPGIRSLLDKFIYLLAKIVVLDASSKSVRLAAILPVLKGTTGWLSRE
jgi:hypothetical protein